MHERILAAEGDRPLIVAQTCLHEGYPEGMTRHVEPYPFETPPYAVDAPHDLARSLAVQRTWFVHRKARFTPVDFTMREDGFEPVDYGRDALWQAIDATRAQGTGELWSWAPRDGRAETRPFGAGAGDVDESNAIQLWSTVYLSVQKPASCALP